MRLITFFGLLLHLLLLLLTCVSAHDDYEVAVDEIMMPVPVSDDSPSRPVQFLTSTPPPIESHHSIFDKQDDCQEQCLTECNHTAFVDDEDDLDHLPSSSTALFVCRDPKPTPPFSPQTVIIAVTVGGFCSILLFLYILARWAFIKEETARSVDPDVEMAEMPTAQGN